MNVSRIKDIQYKMNLVGNQFVSCPSQDYSRIYINGQIIEAIDFPDKQIYISYNIQMQNNWQAEYPEEIRQMNPTQQQLQQYNCLQSITQAVAPVPILNKQGKYSNHFYFCFPIDLQLLAPQQLIKSRWPIIHFEILSTDNWDRNTLLGCGFIQIPKSAGTHSITVETWKPIGGLQSRISEFFIGGSVRVKNLKKISQTTFINDLDEIGPNNRFLYHTESSGKVSFRFNVAIQSRKVKTESRREAKNRIISQQTEIQKEKMPSVIPSFLNTGAGFTGRFTNTGLR